jgi:hypothetical protein
LFVEIDFGFYDFFPFKEFGDHRIACLQMSLIFGIFRIFRSSFSNLAATTVPEEYWTLLFTKQHSGRSVEKKSKKETSQERVQTSAAAVWPQKNMKSVVQIMVALLLLLQQLSHMSSASTSIRGGNLRNDRRNYGQKNLRMLMQDNQDKEDGDVAEDGKEEKDATETPSAFPTTSLSAFPSDVPSITPTAVPADRLSISPVASSMAPVDNLVIDADSNFTENQNPTFGDVEVVYSESNVTLVMNTTGSDETMTNQTIIAEDPMTNGTDAPTDAGTEELLPCYWRFLTGESCTANTEGDVVNAYHHKYLISDGSCHYNEFLGYYRARCEGETDDGPARIWMRDVFCSDNLCNNCLDQGLVRPEIYNSHSCSYIQIKDTEQSVEYDFAFEFVGGCFANEDCSRMVVAGHGK